jgi:hypothetical protein
MEFSSNRKHRLAELTRRLTSLLTIQRFLPFTLKPIFAMDNLSRLHREDYNTTKAFKGTGERGNALTYSAAPACVLSPICLLYRKALVHLLTVTTADLEQHAAISKFAKKALASSLRSDATTCTRAARLSKSH